MNFTSQPRKDLRIELTVRPLSTAEALQGHFAQGVGMVKSEKDDVRADSGNESCSRLRMPSLTNVELSAFFHGCGGPYLSAGML